MPTTCRLTRAPSPSPFPRPPPSHSFAAALNGFRAASRGIDKYVFLRTLQREDASSFYRLLMANAMEIMPYVYTPTVGEACQTYHRLPIETHGVYITAEDAGRVGEALRERSPARLRDSRDLEVAVVTDGERVLGLGDLGAGGMGIAEGKILLYTTCAGVDPARCLPVCLDVGTNNEALLADPGYKGLRARRVRGAAYDALVDEFMREMRRWQPRALVQFEDFGNQNAFRVLDTYRDAQPCFNDDIQGTACVALAAIESGLRVTGSALEEQTILFYGAGEAGVGIGELVAEAMAKRSGGKLSVRDAMRRCVFMDSKGTVCAERLSVPEDSPLRLQRHKLAFAHEGVPMLASLLDAVEALRPTALVGVSTIGGAFDEAVVREMARLNERPIIMPLSNPTHLSECTFEDAVRWTEGRVVFASGSPFPPTTIDSDSARDGKTRTLYPAQANNAYVFPAVGRAAVLAGAGSVTDDDFLVAAEALSRMTSEEELASGRLFPNFDHIQAVSAALTARVCEGMERGGRATRRPAGTWAELVESEFFRPPEEEGGRGGRSKL